VTTAAVARAVLTTALATAVFVGLYVARDALLVIYTSGLLATGLGPLLAVLAVPSAAIIQVVVSELLDERDRLQASRDLATG